MSAVCYNDKEQNYIRPTTKPIDPSTRKSADRQTLPSQNTFNKKKHIAKTGGPVYFPCRRMPSFQMPKNMIFFPKSALFLVIGISVY